jgi:hypothetical protein
VRAKYPDALEYDICRAAWALVRFLISGELPRCRAENPILPETIHPVPMVTIQKLADALYWIGRTAIRGKSETDPEKIKATFAMIEDQAAAGLESDDPA